MPGFWLFHTGMGTKYNKTLRPCVTALSNYNKYVCIYNARRIHLVYISATILHFL